MIRSIRFDQCRALCGAGAVAFRLGPAEDISKAYEKYYGVGAETIDELAQDEVDDEEDLELMFSDDKEIAEGDQEASIIKFVNQVIWQAYRSRATDIHFEPHEDELQIRHRIDGILHKCPCRRRSRSCRRRYFPHQGNERHEHCRETAPAGRPNQCSHQGEEIDIRVSTVPTVYGESVSLRLLTRGSVLKAWIRWA